MQKFHLAWDESRHTLGIRSIDQQHRTLVDLVNELAEAVAHDCECELARQRMETIIRFTEGHFAHEEALMREYSFPALESHAAEHVEVLRKAITLMEALKPNDTNRIVLVTAFLTDCAEHHILHEDRELVLYLREQGLH